MIFCQKKITIRRSSGKTQEATPFPFYLFLRNNKALVRADFVDNKTELCKLVVYEAFKIEEPIVNFKCSILTISCTTFRFKSCLQTIKQTINMIFVTTFL